jgi:hypothetical protein
VAAYREAQLQRKAGAYRRARESLLVCATETCPAIVKNDCVPWLGEVSRALASIIVDAVDQTGPLTAVRVEADGELLTGTLEGPIELDPGSHDLRFSVQGSPAVERHLELRAGERGRHVRVVLTRPVAAPPAAVARPIPPSVIATTGVAALGGVGFAVFGLLGNGQKSDLDACKPNCSSSAVGSVERDYVIADVSLGVGLIALGASAYFFLTRPEKAPTQAGFDIEGVPGGAVLTRSFTW